MILETIGLLACIALWLATMKGLIADNEKARKNRLFDYDA